MLARSNPRAIFFPAHKTAFATGVELDQVCRCTRNTHIGCLSFVLPHSPMQLGVILIDGDGYSTENSIRRREVAAFLGGGRVNELACSLRGKQACFLRISFLNPQFFASIPPSSSLSFLSPCASVHADRLSLHVHAINADERTYAHIQRPHWWGIDIQHPSPPAHLHTATRGFSPSSLLQPASTHLFQCVPMIAQPPTGLGERERRKAGKGGGRLREFVSALGGLHGRVWQYKGEASYS